MSTLSAIHPTLLDFKNTLDPNNNVAQIIEVLDQEEAIQYLPFQEGNLLTGHVTTVRTGLPAPTWRKLYGGVQPTKSNKAKITDTCGMLEAYAEIDQKLADLNGNSAAFRLSEDRAHLEGMRQEFMSTFVYGNEGSEPEAFTGLAPRFNSLSAENARNIINGGGATNLTSLWLCVMGDQTGFGIYPKGSSAGWKIQDKGQVTIENIDGSGGRAEGYRTHYSWDAGFTMRDWRAFSRACNIDVTALTKNAASGVDLIDVMTQMIEKVEDINAGRAFFMVGRTIRSFLRRQIVAKVASSTLTMDSVAGKKVMTFDGIPVVRVDAILSNETAVA